MNKKRGNILLSLSLTGANLFSPHVLWSAPRKPNPDYQAHSSNKVRVISVGFKQRKNGSACAVDLRGSSRLSPSFARSASLTSRLTIPKGMSICSANERKAFLKQAKNHHLQKPIERKVIWGQLAKSAGAGCVIGSVIELLDRFIAKALPEAKTEAGAKCVDCEKAKQTDQMFKEVLKPASAGIIGSTTAMSAHYKNAEIVRNALHSAYVEQKARRIFDSSAETLEHKRTIKETAKFEKLLKNIERKIASLEQQLKANKKAAKQIPDLRLEKKIVQQDLNGPDRAIARKLLVQDKYQNLDKKAADLKTQYERVLGRRNNLNHRRLGYIMDLRYARAATAEAAEQVKIREQKFKAIREETAKRLKKFNKASEYLRVLPKETAQAAVKGLGGSFAALMSANWWASLGGGLVSGVGGAILCSNGTSYAVELSNKDEVKTDL